MSYLENYLGDLEYYKTMDVDSLNANTCGTPEFKSLEELEQHIEGVRFEIENNKLLKRHLKAALEHCQKYSSNDLCVGSDGTVFHIRFALRALHD